MGNDSISNPLAIPATIFDNSDAGNRHLSGMREAMQQIVSDTEKYKQRQESIKAGLDKSLIPPEINWDNVFAPERNEILGDLKSYEDQAMKYYEKGINHLDPANIEAYTEMKKREDEIDAKITASAQHKEQYKNFIDKRASDWYEKYVDDPNTMVNVSEFLKSGQTISDREDYLQKKGSLFAPLAFDPYAYTKKVMDKYTQVPNTDIQNKPGYYDKVTTNKFTPQTEAVFAADILSNPQMKKMLTDEYTSLSPEMQAKLMEDAKQNGNMDSGLDAYAVQRGYAFKPITEEHALTKKTASRGGGSGSTKDATLDPIAVTIAGIRAKDPQYADAFDFNGKTYKKANLMGYKIGTYDKKNYQYDPKTGQPLIGEDGRQLYNMSNPQEIIEQMIYDPDSKMWYYSSNKTHDHGLGVTIGDVNNAYPLTDKDFQTLLWRVTDNIVDHSSVSVKNQLSKLGKLNPDGSVNFDAIISPHGDGEEEKSTDYTLGD